MSKYREYEEKTEALLCEIQKEINFEIVDVEFEKVGGEFNLTAYCDMPQQGGIGIEDCAIISCKLSDLLDRDDFIKEAYNLCVSSPGLTRAFKKDKDYERNIGKDVEIKLFNKKDNQYVVGNLLENSKTSIKVLCNGEEKIIEKKDIALARPYIEF